MRRCIYGSILAVSLACSVHAAPPDVTPVPLPVPAKWAELKAETGRPLRLSSKDAATWILIDDETATLIPDADGKGATLVAPEGRFKLLVIVGQDVGRYVAVFGVAPVPPVNDVLLKPVQAAFDGIADANKQGDKAYLAAVYEEAAGSVKDVNTAAELFTLINGSTVRKIGDRLRPIRDIFGAELGKSLPTQTTAVLTAAQKEGAAKQLTRFAGILGKVK